MLNLDEATRLQEISSEQRQALEHKQAPEPNAAEMREAAPILAPSFRSRPRTRTHIRSTKSPFDELKKQREQAEMEYQQRKMLDQQDQQNSIPNTVLLFTTNVYYGLFNVVSRMNCCKRRPR